MAKKIDELDVHCSAIVKDCTKYIERLNSLYGKSLNKQQNLDEIGAFLKNQKPTKDILQNHLSQAKKTYEKYIEDQNQDPEHHKYKKSGDDSKDIWAMNIDFKTAFALEWTAIIDPKNYSTDADLPERKILFLNRLLDIEMESFIQKRPYISAMGVFARICAGEVYHPIFESFPSLTLEQESQSAITKSETTLNEQTEEQELALAFKLSLEMSDECSLKRMGDIEDGGNSDI